MPIDSKIEEPTRELHRADGKHWWEYLDAIEIALETAAPLPEDVLPALLLLSYRNRALKEGGASAGRES